MYHVAHPSGKFISVNMTVMEAISVTLELMDTNSRVLFIETNFKCISLLQRYILCCYAIALHTYIPMFVGEFTRILIELTAIFSNYYLMLAEFYGNVLFTETIYKAPSPVERKIYPAAGSDILGSKKAARRLAGNH